MAKFPGLTHSRSGNTGVTSLNKTSRKYNSVVKGITYVTWKCWYVNGKTSSKYSMSFSIHTIFRHPDEVHYSVGSNSNTSRGCNYDAVCVVRMESSE